MPNLIGRILQNRYEITKKLGSGGFGDTYLAQDTQKPSKPFCVVKHLQPKDSTPEILEIAKRFFAQEAKILEKLGDNDQIPCLYAYFDEEKEFYLVQEYIDGNDLSKELPHHPSQKWSEEKTIKLLQDILEILAFVHQNKVIHRDIKPENIMGRNKDGKLVLIDFGAVKAIRMASSLADKNGKIKTTIKEEKSITVGIGSLGYMPCEQSMGKPRRASDIYAVGMIGIQALTGKDPRKLEDDPDTCEIIWRDEIEVSEELGDILSKMVRYHFNQRYRNASEALEVLRKLASATPAQTSPTIKVPGISQATAPTTKVPGISQATAPTIKVPTKQNKLKLVFGSLAIAILISVAFAAYFINQPKPKIDSTSCVSPIGDFVTPLNCFSPPDDVTSGTRIKIGGSVSMIPINRTLKERFENRFLNTTIEVDKFNLGSDVGLQNLCEETEKNVKIDLAASSRELTEEDMQRKTKDGKDCGALRAVKIGTDSLVILVKKDNPLANKNISLSQEQVKQIFQCKIAKWSEIVPNWSQEIRGKSPNFSEQEYQELDKIKVVNRSPRSGTDDAFNQLALNNEGFCPEGSLNKNNFRTSLVDEYSAFAKKIQINEISYGSFAMANFYKTSFAYLPIGELEAEDSEYEYRRHLFYVYRANKEGMPVESKIEEFLGFINGSQE